MKNLDVLAEAIAIKKAMKKLGWGYCTGGPYPDNPTMTFTRAGQDMRITVGPKKEPTT